MIEVDVEVGSGDFNNDDGSTLRVACCIPELVVPTCNPNNVSPKQQKPRNKTTSATQTTGPTLIITVNVGV